MVSVGQAREDATTDARRARRHRYARLLRAALRDNTIEFVEVGIKVEYFIRF